MDFTLDLARDFIALAERLNGNAEVDDTGRLVIRLPDGAPTADVAAESITNDDFPHAYVIPADDSTLVIEA